MTAKAVAARHRWTGDDASVIRTDSPLEPWEPAPLPEVVALFSASSAPWWIAGGHAMELAVDCRIRDHADIDVLVLRRDQMTVQEVLAGWQWCAAEPPGTLRPWLPAETLRVGVHDIWCRPGQDWPWRVQVMLDEASGDQWISRRDARIHRSISSIGRTNADGIPYLAPEIQLFYKAKNPRPKDDIDLAAVLPTLNSAERAWLDSAIRDCYGDEHAWRQQLG